MRNRVFLREEQMGDDVLADIRIVLVRKFNEILMEMYNNLNPSHKPLYLNDIIMNKRFLFKV